MSRTIKFVMANRISTITVDFPEEAKDLRVWKRMGLLKMKGIAIMPGLGERLASAWLRKIIRRLKAQGITFLPEKKALYRPLMSKNPPPRSMRNTCRSGKDDLIVPAVIFGASQIIETPDDDTHSCI